MNRNAIKWDGLAELRWDDAAPMLEVRDLSICFERYGRGLRRTSLQTIHDLSLTAQAGQIVAVVGSSGSGKSLLAHAILGLLPSNATVTGTLRYRGVEMTPQVQEALRGSHIAFIPQSVECLDPLMRAEAQVRGTRGSKEAQRALFERYRLPKKAERMYPFELSGGMSRRVLLSTALIEDAEVIIADEPTPGLTHDMAVQAMAEFRALADEGKAVVVITHDLDLAYDVADTVVVFYAGSTLEVAPAIDFREHPEELRHPYSKALWNALPQNGFVPVPGTQPYAGDLPAGCLYAARCPQATDACRAGAVPLRALRGGEVRCHHAS